MTQPDFETSLGVLRILSEALTVPHSLDEGLTSITTMIGELMQTEQTVLLMRDEERGELIVRTRVGIESSAVRVGHPVRVSERLKTILWRTRYLHQINHIEAGIEGIGFPILVLPITVRGSRVGLIITGKARVAGESFDPFRKRMLTLIGGFASLVIENAKVYNYLRQQFAQRSQELIRANRSEAGERDETQHLMVSSLTNPYKVVRLLSESFYKELARAGFDAGHVTAAAAHLLECITRDAGGALSNGSSPGRMLPGGTQLGGNGTNGSVERTIQQGY